MTQLKNSSLDLYSTVVINIRDHPVFYFLFQRYNISIQAVSWCDYAGSFNENAINNMCVTVNSYRCKKRTRRYCSKRCSIFYDSIHLIERTFIEVTANLAIRRRGFSFYIRIVKLLDKVTFWMYIYHIGSLPNYATNYEQLTRHKSIITTLRFFRIWFCIVIDVTIRSLTICTLRYILFMIICIYGNRWKYIENRWIISLDMYLMIIIIIIIAYHFYHCFNKIYPIKIIFLSLFHKW